jgi:PilZ domain-containing protein
MAVLLRIDSKGGKAEYEAHTLDLSQHGVRIHAPVELTPGQVVAVVPTEDPRYTMPARVIWIGRSESNQAGEAGLQLLNSLPAAV